MKYGLPASDRIVNPAWFLEASEEAWSLACRFDTSPLLQGNPSEASVQFLLDDAPHDRLRVGVVMCLFERMTRGHATVEILD